MRSTRQCPPRGSSSVPERRWVAATALGALLQAGAMAGPVPAHDVPGAFTYQGGLARHAAEYAPRRLAWAASAGVQGAKAVYPHPDCSGTVYATAADGLYRSDDGAATWRHLPLAGLAEPGAITDMAFRPGEPETLCLGTRASGVWVSRDGGQTVRQIGAKRSGMASDAVESLVYAPGDPFLKTILAAHGKAAPGVSRGDSEEGTWSVMASDHHVSRIIAGGPGSRDAYLFASETATPDDVGLYYAPLLDAFWQRLVPDFLPTDGVRLPGEDVLYVTSLDKGVLRIADKGGSITELGGADEEWFSVGSTWGSHADQTLVYLYQPTRQGVLWTTQGLAEAEPQNAGLYRGTFVNEQARVRANAGGTCYYAAINGAVWVGRMAAPLRVDSVEVSPSCVTIAPAVLDESRWRSYDGDLADFTAATRAAPSAGALAAALRDLNGAIPNGSVCVVARVSAPTGCVPEVSADLSRFGGRPDTPMKARGDGNYAVNFDVTREGIQHRRGDWRATWPGPMPVSVTARSPGGEPSGGVGTFSLYLRPSSFDFWKEGRGIGLKDVQGIATLDCVRDPAQAASGSWYLKLTVGPGPWVAPAGYHAMRQTIADYYALTFLIRSKGPADDDLTIHLRDNAPYALPTVTPGVAIVAGGYAEGGAISTNAYRRVTIPIADLLKGAEGFLPDVLGWVVFEGESATQRIYLIDDIRFIVSRKELDALTGRTL